MLKESVATLFNICIVNEQSASLRYQSFNGLQHLLLFDDGLLEETDVIAKSSAANLTVIYMLLWDFLRATAEYPPSLKESDSAEM